MEVIMKSKSILVPALLLACGVASATNLFDPTVSSTTVLDGSSIELDGTLHDTNGNPAPWVAELYAGRGECVRLFVTTTAFDAKLTVVAPNGTVYRDDDGGGSLRPLVKIASAPVQGWYTVQVAHYAGLPQNANFTLLYGRYTAGNANCANPTPPFARTRGDDILKDSSQAPAPDVKNPDAP
jgi:hypothetical protein